MSRIKNIIKLCAALAFIMHLAMQITPLWVPLMGAQTIQICSAQGIERVTIDEYGREIPTPKQETQHCSFCLASAVAIDAPQAATYTRRIQISSINIIWKGHQAPRISDNDYAAHLTRGPPAVS